MSRILEDEEEEFLTLALISIPEFKMLEKLKQSYLTNPELQALLRRVENKELGPKYSRRDGIVYYKQKLYVFNDTQLKTRLLDILHNNLIGGHDKTLH